MRFEHTVDVTARDRDEWRRLTAYLDRVVPQSIADGMIVTRVDSPTRRSSRIEFTDLVDVPVPE